MPQGALEIGGSGVMVTNQWTETLQCGLFLPYRQHTLSIRLLVVFMLRKLILDFRGVG